MFFKTSEYVTIDCYGTVNLSVEESWDSYYHVKCNFNVVLDLEGLQVTLNGIFTIKEFTEEYTAYKYIGKALNKNSKESSCLMKKLKKEIKKLLLHKIEVEDINLLKEKYDNSCLKIDFSINVNKKDL